MLVVDHAYARPSRSEMPGAPLVAAAGLAAAARGAPSGPSLPATAAALDSPPASLGRRPVRIMSRLTITAQNDSAFSQKQPASPIVATSTPATAGPRMRAMLNAAAFKAMPFGR